MSNSAIVHVHCQPQYITKLQELGLNYSADEYECTAIVDDIVNINDDEEFVSFYGIDYDFVNCIELA